jgi:hypothetical protein
MPYLFIQYLIIQDLLGEKQYGFGIKTGFNCPNPWNSSVIASFFLGKKKKFRKKHLLILPGC